jgi:glycosyltransferase involved in cell wall biosynthesis
MKKNRIVWICHFTNAEVQSILPVWKNRNEIAPWIPNLLKGFESIDDVEIHIISPHEFLKKATYFKLRNIHYHFIPFGIPIWRRHWPGKLRFDIWINFYFLRIRIKRIVNSVNPVLINLFGAENAYYSSSILDFNSKYPVLITIQGFISQMRGAIKLTQSVKKAIDVEEKILKATKYFCGEQDSSVYIAGYNPKHVFFRLYFPVNETLTLTIENIEKTYDCIFFGRLINEKGVGDFIKVIAEIKIKKQNVTACILGEGDLKPYKEFAQKLNCNENINFVGFVRTQKELFEYVKASRVFLAPPYFERLSSTIRETMFLKVPIVAYATGGIPYINELDENIYLVKTGDYKGMAQKTLLLLGNETLRTNLAEKAYQFALSEFSLSVNVERFLSAYKTILKDTKIN